MAYATLRFYAELNDLLPARRRQRDWTLAFEPPAPARHLIETCGVPHTEVELILHQGASIGLETPVGDGDRLAVYPMFESCDVRPLLRLRPRPLRRPRFLADAHLGALARRLRMLGFDTIWHNDLGDGPSLSKFAVSGSFSRPRLLAAKRREENAGTGCESLIKISTSHQARAIPCFSARRSSAVVMSGN